MISSLAWRNLWRNKLRSLVIIATVTLGIFAGIFLVAFMNGMVKARIHSIISTEISHIQIHKKGFLDNYQMALRITNADAMIGTIQKLPGVKAVTKRIVINSMAASAETGTGVKINGIVPALEEKVTNIHAKIIKGNYFSGSGHNHVVISERLAKKLKVKLNNKIIITLQDIHKDVVGGAFRVTGIYRTDNMLFDEVNTFVRYRDLCRMTGLPPSDAHEIAILLDRNDETQAVRNKITHLFPGYQTEGWQQLSPEAGYLVSAMNQYMYIFIIIILLALCFGIVNTMLMVILERGRELGMLMAIGMNRLRIFMMIITETIYLSLTGGVAGILIGYAFSKYLGKTGIDLYFWKDAFAEIGYSSFVYPEIDFHTMVITTLLVILAGIVSALYPAYKALKLNPAEAIRST